MPSPCNSVLFSISYLKDSGQVTMRGTMVKKNDAKRLTEMGLGIDGELRVKTDGRVVDHNATKKTKDPESKGPVRRSTFGKSKASSKRRPSWSWCCDRGPRRCRGQSYQSGRSWLVFRRSAMRRVRPTICMTTPLSTGSIFLTRAPNSRLDIEDTTVCSTATAAAM